MMKDFLVTTYVDVKMDIRVKTAKVSSTEKTLLQFYNKIQLLTELVLNQIKDSE